jgi:hypothetical protein
MKEEDSPNQFQYGDQSVVVVDEVSQLVEETRALVRFGKVFPGWRHQNHGSKQTDRDGRANARVSGQDDLPLQSKIRTTDG